MDARNFTLFFQIQVSTDLEMQQKSNKLNTVINCRHDLIVGFRDVAVLLCDIHALLNVAIIVVNSELCQALHVRNPRQISSREFKRIQAK